MSVLTKPQETIFWGKGRPRLADRHAEGDRASAACSPAEQRGLESKMSPEHRVRVTESEAHSPLDLGCPGVLSQVVKWARDARLAVDCV